MGFHRFNKNIIKKTMEKNCIINIDDTEYRSFSTASFEKKKTIAKNNAKEILSVIPGTVVDIFFKEGSTIKLGDKILIIEAMKMNNQILSDKEGIIEKIMVKKGDIVSKSQVLIKLK